MTDADLKRGFQILRKWLWLVAAAVLIAAVFSYLAVRTVPPTYRTSVTVLVGETGANPNVSRDDLSTSQRLADAYVSLVRRQPVLQATVQSLGLDISWVKLREQVVAVRSDVSLMEIRVTDTDPRRAKAIADEMVRQLVLLSPTGAILEQTEQHKDFVLGQIDVLRRNILQAETEMGQKKALLANETSARGVMELQDEIGALEIKVANWRNTYASLLASVQTPAVNTISVLEPAFVPESPVGPNVWATVLLACAIGLILSLGGVFLIEHFNDRLLTAEDVSRALDVPTLGSTVFVDNIDAPAESLVNLRDPYSPVTEGYRMLRTNVHFACLEDETILLLVTSAGPQEGKSFTAANLAVSFAQAGKQTILVEADLRRPTVHSFFGLGNTSGLTSILLGEWPEVAVGEHTREVAGRNGSMPKRKGRVGDIKRTVEAYLVQTEVPNLRLLPSGPHPHNPAEILASSGMDRVLEALRASAEVVIVDSPPVLPVADAWILAAKGAGVLLVVEAGGTRSQAARIAKQTITRAGAPIIGVVLNKVKRASTGYYRYRYDGAAQGNGSSHSVARKLLAGLPAIARPKRGSDSTEDTDRPLALPYERVRHFLGGLGRSVEYADEPPSRPPADGRDR